MEKIREYTPEQRSMIEDVQAWNEGMDRLYREEKEEKERFKDILKDVDLYSTVEDAIDGYIDDLEAKNDH